MTIADNPCPRELLETDSCNADAVYRTLDSTITKVVPDIKEVTLMLLIPIRRLATIK
ncbi:MAG: hypothetical protein ACYC4S_06115 [Rhodoferax sp.]